MKKMNPTLQQSIAKAALPLKTIRSKTKPWILNKNQECELFNFDIEAAVRNQGDGVESKLIVDNEVMAYAIMRGELQVRNKFQYTVLHLDLIHICKKIILFYICTLQTFGASEFFYR